MAHPRKYLVTKEFTLADGRKVAVGDVYPVDKEFDLNDPAVDRDLQRRIERGEVERVENTHRIKGAPDEASSPAKNARPGMSPATKI